MSDLVKRLHDLAACKHDDLSIAKEAADEIDRLRAENERLTAEIVRLRAKVAKEIREAAKGSVYAKGRSHTFICGLQDGYEAAAQIACNDHRIIDLALENENERMRAALRNCLSLLDALIAESKRSIEWGAEDPFRMGEWFESKELEQIEEARAALEGKEPRIVT